MKQSKILMGILALAGILVSCEKDGIEQKNELPVSKEVQAEVIDANTEETVAAITLQEIPDAEYTDEKGNPISAKVSTKNRRLVAMFNQKAWHVWDGKSGSGARGDGATPIYLWGYQKQTWFRNPFGGWGSLSLAPNCKLEFRIENRHDRRRITIDRFNKGPFYSNGMNFHRKGRLMRIACNDRKARFAGNLTWRWPRGTPAIIPIWTHGNLWGQVPRSRGGHEFNFNPASLSMGKKITFYNNRKPRKYISVNIGGNGRLLDTKLSGKFGPSQNPANYHPLWYWLQ